MTDATTARQRSDSGVRSGRSRRERPHQRGERPATAGRRDGNRAVSPVVGVVVAVALTVVLAAGVASLVAVGDALREPAPRAGFEASLSATDGFPDGQRLRVVHAGGDRLRVSDLALVVDFEGADAGPRVTGFPTRRLAGEHVRGRDVFDSTYAGIDGALDAAHTDGWWEAGEAASLRVAQHDLDLRAGDRATVAVVHRPTDTVIARETVTATAAAGRFVTVGGAGNRPLARRRDPNDDKP